VKERILLEEQALDSFSNLLFSMLKFWKAMGGWPRKLTIISHAFKQDRFLKLHVPPLGLSGNEVAFLGIDPDYMREGSHNYDVARAEEVRRGERNRGFGQWEKDPLGSGLDLSGKRAQRNPWGASQIWFQRREERESSGVKSMHRVGDKGIEEEFLTTERQPWEDVK